MDVEIKVMKTQHLPQGVQEVLGLLAAGPPRETMREAVDGEYRPMSTEGIEAFGVTDVIVAPTGDTVDFTVDGIQLSDGSMAQVTLRYVRR